MMRRVVTNLLSNALKFSAMREVPRIAVGCRIEKDNYVFYIKDNGIGIDMAYADSCSMSLSVSTVQRSSRATDWVSPACEVLYRNTAAGRGERQSE
jgi:light-regulated signal transduction histidine kinase (bacteriophytochrome)